MIYSVDFLGMLMGDKGTHRSPGVCRKDDSVLANNSDCCGQFKTPIFGILRFSNLLYVQLFFMLDRRFPRNGKICDEPVSDSLKTFSATIERFDHGGKYLRSLIVTPTVLDALVND